jgi:hypothetical protein
MNVKSDANRIDFRSAYKVRDRLCKLMGWPPGESHKFNVLRKVMTGQAVAVSVNKLEGLADEIDKLRNEAREWKRLVNDAERAIGIDSMAVTPDARSLVEWCDEARMLGSRIETMRVRAEALDKACDYDW